MILTKDDHHAVIQIRNRTVFCRCGWTGKADLPDLWDTYCDHIPEA